MKNSELQDIKLMIWLVPVFGIIIPNLSGLFGPFGPSHISYWIGYVYFIFIAYTIWWGNRHLYLRRRKYYDWFNKPIMKIITILFSNIFYTAPMSVFLCFLWYKMVDLQVDWSVIKFTTLFIVIAVIIITHIYETVYLIKDRENDMVKLANLEKSKALAQLEALKNQVDPHFMFNSLNTLSHLVETSQDLALEFIENLADIYRYLLKNKEKELIELREELEFLSTYVNLLLLRFGDSIILKSEFKDENTHWYIPPVSLQVLMENAVKHNEFDENRPMIVNMKLENGELIFKNVKRPKQVSQKSLKVGLSNLSDRFELITGNKMQIENGQEFIVVLPLVQIKGTL